MKTNEKQIRLGKYEGFHGTIIMGRAADAALPHGLVGKGGGKSTNYPMDSDDAFAKRLKLYERQKEMEKATAAIPA